MVVESPVSQGVANYGRIFENILNLYIEKCKLEGCTQILPKSPVTTELGEGGVSDYIAFAQSILKVLSADLNSNHLKLP